MSGKRERVKSKKKKKSNLKFVMIIMIIIALAITVAYVYKKYISSDQLSETSTGTDIKQEEKKKEIKTFAGNDRPIAVMIDNNIKALPHAGLKNAYAVYEVIVEGGESRLMALFKGQDLAKIGPIRSSRHYFLDFALEHDAIYVHFGWSPQAESDIKSLGINNLNGITQSDTDFWRVKDKVAPYNAVTSTAKILDMANRKGYRTTSDIESPFNYTAEEVNLENGELADTITIPYSTSNKVRWEYDSESKTYLRYTRDKKEVEWDSGEEVTAKNIIIEFIANTDLQDGENKDRQDMTTTGTHNGYYITNGKAIRITCTKETRSSKTIYKDETGKEIEMNDGNTFIQVCPIKADVKIVGNAPAETGNTTN